MGTSLWGRIWFGHLCLFGRSLGSGEFSTYQSEYIKGKLEFAMGCSTWCIGCQYPVAHFRTRNPIFVNGMYLCLAGNHLWLLCHSGLVASAKVKSQFNYGFFPRICGAERIRGYGATMGWASSAGVCTGTPANKEPSSNQDLGAGAPHKVCRCGSRSCHSMGSRSGSTVK